MIDAGDTLYTYGQGGYAYARIVHSDTRSNAAHEWRSDGGSAVKGPQLPRTPRTTISNTATMDPLSLALGVITLIQVAAKVVSITTAYTQSVTGVPDEVNSLVSEINLLSSVLGALHTSLNHEDEKHQTFSADFLTPAMEECKAQLEALLGYLQKGRSKRTRLRNLGRRLKWPLRVNETQEWIGRMERFKGTFSLVLQNEDLGIQRKICGNVEDMKVAQEAERVEKKSQ